MKLKDVTIIETGSASDFLRLADHVQGQLHRDRIIMNNETWEGYIIKVDLENGLTMYCWNCRLSRTMTLNYTLIPGDHISCSLVYNLNSGTVIFRGTSLLRPWTNLFFSNNSSATVFELVPRKKIQFIYFAMTKNWLIRQFRNNKNLNNSLKTYISKANDVYFSTSSSQEYDAANEIFKKIQTADSSLWTESKSYIAFLFF